jgi:hypothetical protein
MYIFVIQISIMTYALPSRALPSRALYLIREYSKPITRPDWRDSKPIITKYQLYLYVILKTNWYN